MKKRPEGFLSEENISHESEPFDYIAELHSYLWRFVRAVLPGANGNLELFLDDAINSLEDATAARLSALQTEVEGRGETIRQLREALRPFATEAEMWGSKTPDEEIPYIKGNDGHGDEAAFDVGDLRRARDVFAATAPVEGEKGEDTK